MKALVSFYSETGNTEKIAKAIFDGIELDDKEINPVKKIDATKVNDYDIVFLGSPIIMFEFAKPLKRILRKLPELTTSFALFCTHGAPKEELRNYEEGMKKYGKELETRNGKILGYFDTTGEQSAASKEFVRKFDPEYAKRAEEASNGHPNEEDINAAKKFANEMVKKLTL